jgi:alpha-L-rhamnosidase
LEINYSAQKSETLTIRLGEKLLDGKIDREPGGTIRYQEVQLRFRLKRKIIRLN